MNLRLRTDSHQAWMALAAGLAVAAMPASSRAEPWFYTVSGTVTQVSNPAGPWAAAQVGDRITIVVTAGSSAGPDSTTATSHHYSLMPDYPFQPDSATVGGTTVRFFDTKFGFDSGEAVIANDDGSPIAQDLFRCQWSTPDLGGGLFELRETSATTPVQTGLTGLDWPDGSQLDLSTWATARLEVSGDFGSGATVVSGTIESIFAQSFECFTIDYNADGLVDFADYLEFLNYYEANDPRADLCGCGIVDFISYLIFLKRYDSCGG